METYEAIALKLRREGVDTIFTYQSSGTMHLLNHIHETMADEIEIIHARHEQLAMAMADGYARATNDLGVCIIGRGPALAQTGASLVTAQKGNSKLLVIATESDTGATYDLKAFDQEGFLRSTIGDVASIRNPKTVLPTFAEQIRALRVGDGPAAIQIPKDVLHSDMPNLDGDTITAESFEERTTEMLQPSADRIEDAIDAYLDSDATRPPVLVVGRGAILADAKREIEAFAEQTGALLTTSLYARGLFDSHPYYLGFVGEWGSSIANEYLSESDFIVAIGCSLNPRTTDQGRLLRDDAKLVQIETDPANVGRFTEPTVTILGDAKVSIEALLEELTALGIDQVDEFWTDRLRERISSASILDEGGFPASERLDPRELVLELDAILPTDRKVVSDGGQFARWVLDAIQTPTPSDFVWPYNFVAIGQGLPAGIGVAAAAQATPTFVFCGDAAFMMSLPAVETAARHDIPVTIFVGNDEALGSEYHSLERAGNPSQYSVIETPSLREVSASLGAEAYSVTNLEELRSIETVLQDSPNGPRVVECLLDRNVCHRSRM